MATIDREKRATKELDEAKEALADFKRGKRGQKLEELQLSGELSQREKEQLTRLEADEKELRDVGGAGGVLTETAHDSTL